MTEEPQVQIDISKLPVLLNPTMGWGSMKLDNDVEMLFLMIMHPQHGPITALMSAANTENLTTGLAHLQSMHSKEPKQ